MQALLLIMSDGFFFNSLSLLFYAAAKFIFIECSVYFYRFNEYGVDGGPAAKALRPKFDAFAYRVHSQVGFQLPEIDVSLYLSVSLYLIWGEKNY